eukprot:451633-Amphidinium_carterae.1
MFFARDSPPPENILDLDQAIQKLCSPLSHANGCSMLFSPREMKGLLLHLSAAGRTKPCASMAAAVCSCSVDCASSREHTIGPQSHLFFGRGPRR